MGITIGIDIGGSTTKIVGIGKGELIAPLLVRASDPVASLFGAFGKFVSRNGLRLADIERIMVTGVGSSYIERPIYGIATAKVEEFLANGLGGLYLTGLTRALIVSMGTGTAFVEADGARIRHVGGTGVGGGTLVGLSGRLLNIRDIALLIKTAEGGDLRNVDLMVGDITRNRLPNLPPETTASNFGRISDLASASDIAMGLFNLVFEAIGSAAVFAARPGGFRDIVLIGNLTTIPCARSIFQRLDALFGINFVIPQDAEFATAAGAALAFTQNRAYESIAE